MKWKLRDIMDEYGDTMEDLATYLEIAYPTLSKKFNQHTDFNQTEIKKIKLRYNLTPEQVDIIFFS